MSQAPAASFFIFIATQVDKLELKLKLPDFWQRDAIHALRDGHDVVVDAPTGAGKTYIFEMLVEGGWRGNCVYTVPTRALANDKLLEWREKGWNVGISTGDVVENPDAPVIVATLEARKGQFLRGEGPSVLVVDEYQMLADDTRGVNYELVISLAPPETRLLLLSGSVGNPARAVEWLRRLGRRAKLVSCKERPVPLEEIMAEALPDHLPSSIRGTWPRIIGRALEQGMAPLLAFAPRRKAAEMLALQLARSLPDDEPLELTPEQRRLAGDTLSRLLRQRIAFHHSGLDYKQRAGLIEPLAKAGQLRVVVATMGLSAGINFSLRSVLVTDRAYRSGALTHLLRPDELLQMMGRAGRRGLDKRGYVIVAPGKPRLAEARPIMLKRTEQVDWPSLIAVMAAAADRGEDPREAAQQLAARLFSQRMVPLGLDNFAGSRPSKGVMVQEPSQRSGSQVVEEILASNGEWERARALRRVKLGDCLARQEDGEWVPALSLPGTLSEQGFGRLCKLSLSPLRYGKELPIARFGGKDEGELVLTKSLMKELRALDADLAKQIKRTHWTLDALEKRIVPLVGALSGGGSFAGWVDRKDTFYALVDYSAMELAANVDSLGAALLNTERRRREVFYDLLAGLGAISSNEERGSGSPATIWYRLGLIDSDAMPTRRGRLFSLFNHGEGLAIAAALEDESYPIEQLVYDLANLRAGHRFDPFDKGADRLGTACRGTYGEASFDGYLHKGLPTTYGEGAADVLMHLERHPGAMSEMTSEELSSGDIERARLEWRSLLNHCASADNLDWDRWLELKRHAAWMLEALPAPKPFDFPPLTQAQRTRHKSFIRFE
ncbi:MAG: DEAD/DEAH box helicase [Opitutales bacterium]|nr:DEAD/DEAH box helicase [Opitutales bacterium]